MWLKVGNINVKQCLFSVLLHSTIATIYLLECYLGLNHHDLQEPENIHKIIVSQ